MAESFYFLPTLAGTTTHLAIQENGSAPTAGLFSPSNTGWVGAGGQSVVTATHMSDMDSQVVRTVGLFDATVKPTGIDTTLGNAFRTPLPKTGNYPASNWVINLAAMAQASAFNGTFRFRVRVYADNDDTGASPRELTTTALLTNISTANLSLTVSQSLSVTWAAPEIVLEGEYLFFAVACDIRTAGTTVNGGREIHLYKGSGSVITTPDFVPVTLKQMVGMIPLK